MYFKRCNNMQVQFYMVLHACRSTEVVTLYHVEEFNGKHSKYFRIFRCFSCRFHDGNSFSLLLFNRYHMPVN